MTELSFLLNLLLEHKLPRPTKLAITARIKEIEERVATSGYTHPIQAQMRSPKMDQRPIGVESPAAVAHQMIEEIAQTPAAAAALAQRAEAIRIATSGKPEHGRTSPRKF